MEIEIPTIEVTAALHGAGGRRDVPLDRAQAFVRRGPGLAPRPPRAPARQAEAGVPVMSPGREPVREATAQTRERLEHVQRGGERAHAPQPAVRGSGWEVPARAADGLHDDGAHRGDQQREREEERSPQDAQGGQPGEHRGEQEPLGHER